MINLNLGVRWQPILLVLLTELIRWTQAAGGAAGRANVGLYLTSSLLYTAVCR